MACLDRQGHLELSPGKELDMNGFWLRRAPSVMVVGLALSTLVACGHHDTRVPRSSGPSVTPIMVPVYRTRAGQFSPKPTRYMPIMIAR